jgi:hypothetical protein
MQIINGIIIINNDIAGTSPCSEFTGFTDIKGNKYQIDNKIIVRLYELLKFHHEKPQIYLGKNIQMICTEL